jgi:protein-tyrosine phosphatase
MAAGFLASSSADLGSVAVHSGGLLESGRAVPVEVARAAAEYGLDLAAHRSHQITAPDVARADLVIGMARLHVREMAVLEPSRWPVTFTLRELVRRGRLVGRRGPREPLMEWLAGLHAGRRATDLHEEYPDDDIDDPIGGPYEGYRAMARQVHALTGELQLLIWGDAASG